MITAPTEFSGLQVWLDASDTTRLFQLSGGTTAVAANGDPVGYWGDKSGNNRHFTNIGGSATTRPTWVSSLSTVRFDGTNDYLSSFFNITYTAQTVFVVVSRRVDIFNARIYSQVSSGGVDNTATGAYIPCFAGIAGQLGSFNTGSTKSVVTPRALSSFDVFTSWVSSVSGVNFLNGSSGAYYGTTLNYAVALSRLGAAATTAGSYFNGDISEVIVYNRALTNNERADVEYYLTRKWNFLNSIPRQVYGIKNGLWSLTDTWSVSAEPSPWNYPLSADNAYTNTFTITADSSTRVSTIRNSTVAPNILSGGSFVLANGVSLSAFLPQAEIVPVVIMHPSASATFVGNVYSGDSRFGNTTTKTGISAIGDSFLTLIGNVSGIRVSGSDNTEQNTAGIRLVQNSKLRIFGNVIVNDQGSFGAINQCIVSTTNGLIDIIGNIIGNAPRSAAGASNSGGIGILINSGSATVSVTGNLIGPNGNGGNQNDLNAAIRNTSSTTNIFVVGDVYGPINNSSADGWGTIRNTGNGNITIVGNVYSGLGFSGTDGQAAIRSDGTGTVSVTGNLITLAGNNNCILTTNTNSRIQVTSNNINAANGAAAIRTLTTTTIPVSVYNANIINAPNGRQAIYAPRYQVFPTGSAQYTRQASNGYDSYVDYWTSNSTFSYPASSDVALGTTYSNSTLSGSMAVPSPSSVALGAPVGTTTGTASITFDNVLSQPIANLTTPNSIGARLKNITTSQALSAIVDSLEF